MGSLVTRTHTRVHPRLVSSFMYVFMGGAPSWLILSGLNPHTQR